MKVHKALQGASYDPRAVKAICQAFDAAWAGIADKYDASEAEDARLKLADSVLAIAPLHGTDIQALSDAALTDFALSNRARPGDQGQGQGPPS